MKNLLIITVALVAFTSAAPAEESVREKKSPAMPSNIQSKPHSDDKQGQSHQPEARTYGGYVAPVVAPAVIPVASYGSYGGGCGYTSPVIRGPSVGVFPNSNIGGCAVPLLLSCSPSVSSGHIIKQYGSSYGGHPAYRESESEQPDTQQKSALEQALAQAQAIQQESMRQAGLHQAMPGVPSPVQQQGAPQNFGQTAAYYPEVNLY